MFDIRDNLAKLPAEPGVYLHKDEFGEIIYVGKAASLKSRVRQYFAPPESLDPKTRALVSHIAEFEYIVTGTEAEALLLENTLIKRHRPRYNVMLLDDKTYPYIKVTLADPYPRIVKTRVLKNDGSKYFGPYADVGALNRILDLINGAFRLKQCARTEFPNNWRMCLNGFLGRCDAPCRGGVDPEEYGTRVRAATDFLRGRSGELVRGLKERMSEAAEAQDYEEAARFRDLIRDAEAVTERQKVDLLSSGSMDVLLAAPAEDGRMAQAILFFVRDGRLVGREIHHLDAEAGSEKKEIAAAFLKQYYANQTILPKEILLEEHIDDEAAIEAYLSEAAGFAGADDAEEETAAESAAGLEAGAGRAEEKVGKGKTEERDGAPREAGAGRAEEKVGKGKTEERDGAPREAGAGRIEEKVGKGKTEERDGALREAGVGHDAKARGARVRLTVPERGKKHDLLLLAQKDVRESAELRAGLLTARHEKEAAAVGQLLRIARARDRGDGSFRDRGDGSFCPTADRTKRTVPSVPSPRIEAYDISHTGGADSVGAMVVFRGAEKSRRDYRRFKIRTEDTQRARSGADDYGAMQEVLVRRFRRGLAGEKGFDELPDVILIDGGRGHVAAAEQALSALNVELPVLGMVKDDRHRTRSLVGRDTADEPQGNTPPEPPCTPRVSPWHTGEPLEPSPWHADEPSEPSPWHADEPLEPSLWHETDLASLPDLFHLIGAIQEEVHRFAVEYHRSLRGKRAVSSELDEIPGVGEKRRAALLLKFGDIEGIKKASADELAAVPGMNRKAAEQVASWFHKQRDASEQDNPDKE